MYVIEYEMYINALKSIWELESIGQLLSSSSSGDASSTFSAFSLSSR